MAALRCEPARESNSMPGFGIAESCDSWLMDSDAGIVRLEDVGKGSMAYAATRL